jgi:tRNA dimethylallyltransferase
VPPKLLVIAGPTAAGKTGVAVSLAAELGAEVVSADSMQVYRGLDIGTAKPTAKELNGVPHHLIDIVDPDEPFDAAAFVRRADEVIRDITARGKRTMVVGGTGLYIRTLLHGLQKGPPPDPSLRAELTRRAEASGWPALHAELAHRDPETATRLHQNDGVRILRALEVLESTGVSISRWQERHQFGEKRYEALHLCLTRPREALNRRIDARVDQMMAEGWLEEVRALIARGYGPALKPMQGLGYRRLCEHLAGTLGLDEAIEKTKTDTRRFAKRQVTWFKKEPGLQWVSPDISEVAALAASFWR